MNIINVYTDGSTLNIQNKGSRRGGIGVFFGDNISYNKSIPLIESATNRVTNQVAELQACITAIEIAIEESIILENILNICTDSMYTINSITKWCKKWKSNNWKKSDGKIIENLEYISKLYEYYLKYNIKFTHVRAHMTKPPHPILYMHWYGNMMADKLATDASKSIL
jgi:ribonuclease HI